MPQITVIIPVYKVEPYLCRCLDSILNQTFFDFELIFIDDGSPDGCGAICDEYATKDNRIRVIHQLNGGLSAARNSGIDWAFACSECEWIVFVDSDDWVHPQYLEYLYRAAIENKVSISVCDYSETDLMRSENYSLDYHTKVVNGIDFFASEKNVTATVAWNKLYHKELFNNLRYPFRKINEDEFITYKLIYEAETIAYIAECLYYYFVNPHGITKKSYSLKRLDAIEAFEGQCQFFREKGRKAYYDKWVYKLTMVCYPYHIAMLNEIGETEKAYFLRKRGRKLVIMNFSMIKELDIMDRDTVLSLYFPTINRLSMPICNFSRMLSRGGMKKVVHYYIRKFRKNKN